MDTCSKKDPLDTTDCEIQPDEASCLGIWQQKLIGLLNAMGNPACNFNRGVLGVCNRTDINTYFDCSYGVDPNSPDFQT